MASVTKPIGRLFNRKYSDTEIMEGLGKMDADILQYMYRENKSSVSKMFKRFGLNGYAQIHDILMDALMATIDNIQTGKYQSSGHIISYYLTICRNICVGIIRNNPNVFSASYLETTLENIKDLDDRMEGGIFDLAGGSEKKVSLLISIVKKMDEICISLFDLRFGLMKFTNDRQEVTDKKGYREIALLLNMTEANARKKYERCYERLNAEYQRRLQHIQ
jgi:hypothetical protein